MITRLAVARDGTGVALPPTGPASRVHELPPLPYLDTDLAPVISPSTVRLHYGKHNAGYIEELNGLIAGTRYADLSLAQTIQSTAGTPELSAIFNNASQAWNHAFYWRSLAPKRRAMPRALRARLEESFGDTEAFASQLLNAAVTQFGSGWAWLVLDGKKLKIVKTSNAGAPMTEQLRPLLVIDVWEHAYYLDFQNRRADYVRALLDNILNWDFAAENLGAD